jgi:predicted outer membrane protein
MKRLAVLLLAMVATPALAHQGDHTQFDPVGLILHVLEPDHVIFAALAILTGVLAYRAGRRAEARSHARKDDVT